MQLSGYEQYMLICKLLFQQNSRIAAHCRLLLLRAFHVMPEEADGTCPMLPTAKASKVSTGRMLGFSP